MDLFETMRTMRAMRRLKPDPVPRELIEKVVAAGICAPNGGGLQTWAFIAVDDASLKRQIATHVARWFDAMLTAMGITADIRQATLAGCRGGAAACASPLRAGDDRVRRRFGSVQRRPAWLTATDEARSTGARSAGRPICPGTAVPTCGAARRWLFERQPIHHRGHLSSDGGDRRTGRERRRQPVMET
jgi:nitroreductase